MLCQEEWKERESEKRERKKWTEKLKRIDMKAEITKRFLRKYWMNGEKENGLTWLL